MSILYVQRCGVLNTDANLDQAAPDQGTLLAEAAQAQSFDGMMLRLGRNLLLI